MENYDTTIASLETQVRQLDTVHNTRTNIALPTISGNNVNITLIVIPIIVTILLYTLNPSFIKTRKHVGTENETVKKDIFKILGWTVGISIVLISGMYLYNYKKSNPI